jgi:hypothetical protein
VSSVGKPRKKIPEACRIGAILAAIAGAAVLAVLTVRLVRTATAADEESAPEAEYRFPAGVEPFPGRAATWVDVDPAEWTPK